jgi:hypothetical protein
MDVNFSIVTGYTTPRFRECLREGAKSPSSLPRDGQSCVNSCFLIISSHAL